MAQNNHKKPTAAGKSSFDLIDAAAFYRELDLKPGITFLDVACGRGAYSLKASEIVGSAGTVYAVDLWQEGIEQLKASAVEENALNIKAFVSDAGRHIPLDDQVVDVCLMATVLHDFVEDQISKEVLHEIVRVMKPGGRWQSLSLKKWTGRRDHRCISGCHRNKSARCLSHMDFLKSAAWTSGPIII